MITLPTLNQLYTGILSDLETKYSTSISLIGKVVLRAQAMVQAGKLKLVYLAIGNLQKNIFVDTADSESIGGTLERWGRVKLGRNPYQAIQGQYVLQITGSVGATIKASTTFKSDDSSLSPGYLFVLDNDYTLVSANDFITVRALTAGEESKLNLSDTLTATSPIALVNSSVSVYSISVQPLAAEDLEVYRQKIIDSYRLEPQGGAGTDYRIWASDAQGVKAVYPYATNNVPCGVTLYIEATIADSTDGKGTPSASIISDVTNVVNFNPDTTLALNERGRRPLQVVMNYQPVTIKTIDINIAGSSFTTSQQSLLLTAITNTINAIRPFIDSVDDLALKNDTLDNNKIISAILNQVPGSTFGAITIKVNSVTYATYTFDNGNIGYLNSVTYV